MQDEGRPNLHTILPARQWITLTEAATALAFGEVVNAERYERHQSSVLDWLEDDFKRTVIPARNAVLAACLPVEDGFAAEALELREVQEHLDANAIRSTRQAEREKEDRDLIGALRRILDLAQQGRLNLDGLFEGAARREPISPREAAGLEVRGPEPDRLWVVGSQGYFQQVTVERAGILRSINGESDLHASHEISAIEDLDAAVVTNRFKIAAVEATYSERVAMLDGPQPSIEEDVKYMKGLFPKLPRDEVRKLRSRIAPQWKRSAGRPRKSTD